MVLDTNILIAYPLFPREDELRARKRQALGPGLGTC
jgi:hypothetical protein